VPGNKGIQQWLTYKNRCGSPIGLATDAYGCVYHHAVVAAWHLATAAASTAAGAATATTTTITITITTNNNTTTTTTTTTTAVQSILRVHSLLPLAHWLMHAELIHFTHDAQCEHAQVVCSQCPVKTGAA